MLRAREEAKELSREARGEEREERERRARSTCPRATFMKTLCIDCAAATNKITPWIIPPVVSFYCPVRFPRSTVRRAPRLNYQRFPFCIADYLPRSPLVGTADKQRQRVLRAGYSQTLHVHPLSPRVINEPFCRRCSLFNIFLLRRDTMLILH